MAKRESVPVINTPSIASSLSTAVMTHREQKTNEICSMKPDNDPIVHGIFENVETPGLTLKFSFRAYAGPIKKYEMKHGEEYDVPLSVAKHLNSCTQKIHANLMDKNGNAIKVEGKGNKRFSFRTADYL